MAHAELTITVELRGQNASQATAEDMAEALFELLLTDPAELDGYDYRVESYGIGAYRDS